MATTKGYLRRIALWLLDVVCVTVAFWLSVVVRFGGLLSSDVLASCNAVFVMLLVMTVLCNSVSRENRGFMKRSVSRELGYVLRYNLLLLVGVAIGSLAFHIQPSPSRLLIALFVIINIVVMMVGRRLAKLIARAFFKQESNGSPIVMIVEPAMRTEVQKHFKTGLTFSIAGWLELTETHLDGLVNGASISCEIKELPECLKACKADEIPDFFVCAPQASERVIGQVINAVERYGTNCHVAVNMPDPNIQGARLDYFGEMPVISYFGRGSALYRNVIKRIIDIVFSLVVIIVAFIPGVICALVIAVQSKGAPFYTQSRLGRGGKHFNLIKFRSMVVDAEDNLEKYFTPEQLAEWHAEHKVNNDPRVTSLGRILRKTSLDEFPQFINVLKGDMSVVGPRPIVDEELQYYGDRAEEFLSIRPGITGWWQTVARNDATYADGERQDLELYYVRHASFTLDLNIVKRTMGAIFGGTGK